MHQNSTKCSLSSGRRRLIEVLQRINFGRLEGLHIRGSEPVFTPPPREVRSVKFGGDNGPRPELTARDFVLKQEHSELFALLDEFQDGRIERLDVRHGLPCHAEVAVVAK